MLDIFLFRPFYFYPRPPRGGRRYQLFHSFAFDGFLSTPSARRATRDVRGVADLQQISIHALREEGDQWRTVALATGEISIHALREEGDSSQCRFLRQSAYFYPRPPRGGRRCTAQMIDRELVEFLSTPSARRATCLKPAAAGTARISIHALREEGDHLGGGAFRKAHMISIHALREEGDHHHCYVPPRHWISIHALREEGDSKNRDKISIFKQIIQHSARI